MRVLVAYASKHGGTTGIAETITVRLHEQGIDADAIPADRVGKLAEYDGFVVGSCIYGGRWQGSAIRVLKRLTKLQPRPRVWLFHSGPLAESAGEPQPLPTRVAKLAAKLGVEHVDTIGGRLDEHAAGWIARAMARNGKAGDWRSPEQIVAAADRIAAALGA